LFLHSSAKQVYVNMPFNFSFCNSHYRGYIHGSSAIYLIVPLPVGNFRHLLAGRIAARRMFTLRPLITL
jgi:hypothetical protein